MHITSDIRVAATSTEPAPCSSDYYKADATDRANSEVREAVEHQVRNVTWKGHLKRLDFIGGAASLWVPRSACVARGNRVRMADGAAWVLSENGEAQISPPYVQRERLEIGGLILDLVIKEISEAAEFVAYRALTELHYRGRTLCGRTARLVLRSFHPAYPDVIGYVEITSPFYMNKPRASILDAPFRANGVAWEAWDRATLRRYIHTIARVARCVIYPEFRGLGLGQLLLRHAADFALHRWQLAGWKPYFLEISADMLKFVPFAAKAGMVYVGETEGNLARVRKDIEHLLRQQEEISGNRDFSIVNQHAVRIRRLRATMEREGLDADEVLQRLNGLSHRKVLRDFHLFYDILSLPKPTYFQGLTAEARDFVRERAAAIGCQNGRVPSIPSIKQPSGPIVFDNVCLAHHSHVRRTWQTHAIHQAFGIAPDQLTQQVVRNLSLEIRPGSVLLVTGPSGSGKTTLLRLFAEKGLQGAQGTAHWPDNYHPGVLAPIRSQKALIEVLGQQDVHSTLHLMGLVGLSDAFTYLKRYEELSNGQQYRAMLARLIAGRFNVWLADEFCATLDVVSANVVADRLQRTARSLGATLIVAASQTDAFLDALKPDQVLQLSSSWEHYFMDGRSYLKGRSPAREPGSAPVLYFSPDCLPAVRTGHKQTTIRRGRKYFSTGLALLVAGKVTVAVIIMSVRHTRLHCLTEGDAKLDGFNSLPELYEALASHYPDLNRNSWITIVGFSPLCVPDLP
jgi:ABC-type ATPase with predicted acetyltransferase domain